jgi:hypothetical protein
MTAAGERHMNDLEIASYLDRGMTAVDRDRAEDHMTECAECRHKVADAQQLIQTMRRPRRMSIGIVAALAAAAAIVIVPTLSRNSQSSAPVMREAGVATNLRVYSPSGETVTEPLRFVWASAANAVSYDLTLSKPDGTAIWSATLSDTTATVPSDIHIDRGASYVWYADAKMADGTTRTTGLREIRISR